VIICAGIQLRKFGEIKPTSEAIAKPEIEDSGDIALVVSTTVFPSEEIFQRDPQRSFVGQKQKPKHHSRLFLESCIQVRYGCNERQKLKHG
jgi:hypothetical protein